MGLVLWAQGFPDDALRHAEEAIAAARAAAHPLSEALALSFAAILQQLRGEVALCRERAERAIALGTEQVLPYWVAIAMIPSGWALVKTGQPRQGLPGCTRGSTPIVRARR